MQSDEVVLSVTFFPTNNDELIGFTLSSEAGRITEWAVPSGTESVRLMMRVITRFSLSMMVCARL